MAGDFPGFLESASDVTSPIQFFHKPISSPVNWSSNGDPLSRRGQKTKTEPKKTHFRVRGFQVWSYFCEIRIPYFGTVGLVDP